MIKAKIKNIDISGDSLDSIHPREKNNASYHATISIGVEDEDSSDYFELHICTPKYLELDCRKRNNWINNTLIINEWDSESIENVIKEKIEGMTAGTWLDLSEKIGKLIEWQFEDYEINKNIENYHPINAEVKNIDIIKEYLNSINPNEKDFFCIDIVFTVGTPEKDNSNYFIISICSPRWIEKFCKSKEIWANNMLVVPKWDPESIKCTIQQKVESMRAETWDKLATKISRIARWEFEDFEDYI